jgi:hypothetical protein
MKVILSLPCELEEVPQKLFLLTQSDWNTLSRKVNEEFFDKDPQYLSAMDLFKLVETIRGSLVELDSKLETTADLLKEQQAAALGIGAPEAAEAPADLQEALNDYHDGIGLPTGSE